MQQSRRRSGQADSQSHSNESATAQGAGASAMGDMSLAALGAAPRDRNLPFRFSESGLAGVKPGSLARKAQAAMFEFGSDGKKDGASLSDPERLYLVVQTLAEGGASDAAIKEAVANAFFDRGGLSSGRDVVHSVSYSPDQPVQVEFRSSGGYQFNQGKILPMIVSP
ncbi:MAG: hypothetical protein AB8H79_21755, partial [Myxococcota bacterium]